MEIGMADKTNKKGGEEKLRHAGGFKKCKM